MSDLGEDWTNDIDAAIERAKSRGRFEIAEYLSLKASNDAVRRRSVKWLFDSVSEIVDAFNSHGGQIRIRRNDAHRFRFGRSDLTGSVLDLRKGIRRLTLEAGWTRSPGDGFMRGGALACATISHFGFPKQNEELVLLRFDGVPHWFVVAGEKQRVLFNVRSLKRHFEVFLG